MVTYKDKLYNGDNNHDKFKRIRGVKHYFMKWFSISVFKIIIVALKDNNYLSKGGTNGAFLKHESRKVDS